MPLWPPWQRCGRARSRRRRGCRSRGSPPPGRGSRGRRASPPGAPPRSPGARPRRSPLTSPAEYPAPHLSSVGVATEAPDRITEQRRALPNGPGVYIFRDAKRQGALRGQGALDPQARGRPLLEAGRPRGDRHGRPDRATSTSSPPRPRPRRCSPSRSSSSATGRSSTSGCATTSRTPTSGSAWTRTSRASTSRARSTAANRVYFGPFSNAKRVRETLDLLGKVFMYRTCDGPQPGRASGSPCLDYYIKRCQAPCVGYVSKEEYRENVETIIDFLSGRYRHIEKALDQGMKKAAEEQEFEQAAQYRNKLKAVRSLLERQRISNAPVGTLDAIAVAAEGTDANAQVFQIRDGVLADRQSFYLENAGAARRGRGGRGVRAPVLRERDRRAAAGDRAALGRGPETPSPRRSPSAAARRSRSATPSAATSAASSSWPSATRGSRSTRTGSARSAAARSGSRRSTGSSGRSAWSRSRCGSSASTSRT